jgi:hypothetical protein
MDGLLGVAGMIITSDCGSFPDSFPAFRTGKIIANDHDFFLDELVTSYDPTWGCDVTNVTMGYKPQVGI